MNQKVLRLCILLSAAALAACTAKKPRPALTPAGTTVQPVNTYRTPQPAGQRAAAGTTVRPAGSSASYTAVDYAALPQWSHQKPRILPERLRKIAKPTRLAGRLHAGRANPT